jgi:predicted aspartyl protease
MVEGSFAQNLPWIPVTVANNHAVQTPYFVLDTGFTGDLQVTNKIAKELGLVVSSVTKSRIANGVIVDVPTALAVASMQGMNRNVQVMISDSMPLAGISFLTKFQYTATVDCNNRTVLLTP